MHPPLGTVITEKYRLDRVVGTGDMSTVYAATNLMTGKQVAIKLRKAVSATDDPHSLRLLREAQAAAAIDHPNVVNVFDVGRHEDALFLVMELLHGEPLSALMLRGVGDPARFVGLMMPVLCGVHAAHRIGVVHRDLCPDNIFLCRAPSGEPRGAKVLDFGISRPADPGSDIHALGVILYRAFAGASPYGADSASGPALPMADRPATPLHERCPELASGLADVVMRAIARDPDARFPSVAALGEALEPYADGAVFWPGAAERDSATQLRYLRVPPKLPVPRVFAPPRARHTSSGAQRSLHTGRTSVPPPRENRPVLAALAPAEPVASGPAHPKTTALDLHELFDVAEPPRAELRPTEVPRPELARRGLERPTSDALEVMAPRRLSSGSLRNASRVVAVLLVIGVLASWLGLPRRAHNEAAAASSASRAEQPRRATPPPGVTPALSLPASVIPDGKEAPARLHFRSRDRAQSGAPSSPEAPHAEPRTTRAGARQGAEGNQKRAGGAAAFDPGLTTEDDNVETPGALRGSAPPEAMRLEQNPYLHR